MNNEIGRLIELLAKLTWPLGKTTRRFLEKKRREFEPAISLESASEYQLREITRLRSLIDEINIKRE